MIGKEIIEQIYRYCEEAYPDEGFGVVMGAKNDDKSDTVYNCRNVQNQLHSEEPDAFPMTARSAYAIDSKEMLKIDKILREKNWVIKAIYHSHPDNDAFFSAVDKKLAMIDENTPAYPDASQIVVSVKNGKADHHKIFIWNEPKKQFLEP